MITVAVAARTMDRQARYRSLLPAREFAVISALDCLTLARLAKTRPVDVVVFDLQKPAMPADAWLNLIEGDPDLKHLPTVWVGRDILPGVFTRVQALAGSLTIPARPDSRILAEAIMRITALAEISRRKAGDPHPRSETVWLPEEDIIDQALVIFNEPAEESRPSAEPAKGEPGAQEWLVSELDSSPDAGRKGKPHGETESRKTEAAEHKEEIPTEDSSISLDAEEFGTGGFAPVLQEKPVKTPSGVVNEKILPITTNHGFKSQAGAIRELVQRVTREVLAELSVRLADELISRIDPELVRRLVEKKLTGTGTDPPPTAV